MTKEIEITNPSLRARVRARYSTEIASLEALAFRCLTFKLETGTPFSLLSYLPELPLMLRAKEILIFPFPLRLSAVSVLCVHAEPSTIASCMGLGVKFFTNFAEGSLLISSTLVSHVVLQDPALQNPTSQIIRNPPRETVNDAWALHRSRVAELEALGKKVRTTNSFADYVEVSEREEADLRYAESVLQRGLVA